jgi:integrase
MAGKQAKILSEQRVEDLLFFAKTTRNPDRNRVIVLLSTKAGLRAAEIANLTWEMVVEPTRNVSSHIELRDHAAKMGSGRTVPVSALLHEGSSRGAPRTEATVQSSHPNAAAK